MQLPAIGTPRDAGHLPLTSPKSVATPKGAASLATPRRGRRGVLSSGRQDTISEFDQGVLPLPRILDKPGTTEAIDLLEHELVLADHFPGSGETARNAGVQETESGYPTSPDTGRQQVQTLAIQETPRSKRKERNRIDLDAEVQRKVRGGGPEPGHWDAPFFCETRRRLLDEGRLESISALTGLAAQASHTALEAGEYRLPAALARHVCHVQIPKRSPVQFFGLDNLDLGYGQATNMAPPIICSTKRTLEAAMEMTKLYPSHLIAASFDATDFSKDGRRLLGVQKARSAAQQELFIRTNFEYHCKVAQKCCGDGRMQEQLTASTDPLMLAASEVVIFRGQFEEGYPFLRNEDLVTISMLITGRPRIRPLLTGHGEYFATQEDYLCFMDRLNLIARGAISIGIQDHNANKATTADEVDQVSKESPKPVLVIGLHDLNVAAAQQPRHSIATALKGWRAQWGRHFEAVLVACGDSETATIMDKTVNGNIYVTALAGKPVLREWHWHEPLLALSVNSVLSNIGGRNHPKDDQLARSTTKSSKELRKQKTEGDPLSPKTPKTPKTPRKLQAALDAKLPPEEQMERQISRRRSSFEMAEDLQQVISDHETRCKNENAPERRTSNVWSRGSSKEQVMTSTPSQETSRMAYERHLKNRLADQFKVDPIADVKKRAYYQDPTSELQAGAGEKRAIAVKAFMGLGKDTKKASEEKEKANAAWLEKTTKSLEMPEELKTAITDEVNGIANAAPLPVDMEKAVFDSVQSMAFQLDNRLQKLRERELQLRQQQLVDTQGV